MPIAPKAEQIEVLAEMVKEIWEIHCSGCNTTESVANVPSEQIFCGNDYDAASIFYSHGWRYKLKDHVVMCPNCRPKGKGRR